MAHIAVRDRSGELHLDPDDLPIGTLHDQVYFTIAIACAQVPHTCAGSLGTYAHAERRECLEQWTCHGGTSGCPEPFGA